MKVIGFNHNEHRVQQYKNGIDSTNEVLKSTMLDFTPDGIRLREVKFIIVTVPTPINTDHITNLYSVENSSRIVGRDLIPGSIVVYESNVYPEVAEDVCVPILEKESGFKV